MIVITGCDVAPRVFAHLFMDGDTSLHRRTLAVRTIAFPSRGAVGAWAFRRRSNHAYRHPPVAVPAAYVADGPLTLRGVGSTLPSRTCTRKRQRTQGRAATRDAPGNAGEWLVEAGDRSSEGRKTAR